MVDAFAIQMITVATRASVQRRLTHAEASAFRLDELMVELLTLARSARRLETNGTPARVPRRESNDEVLAVYL